MTCHSEVKVQCNICKQIIEVPKGMCEICFSDVLGNILDQKDDPENSLRHNDLTIWINNIAHYEYERGVHNTKCKNQLDLEGFGLHWTQL